MSVAPSVPTGTDPSQAQRAFAARQAALRQIGLGIVVFIVGLVITLVTYHNAASSPTGGTYLVAWGPMLFGAIAAVRGLLALSRVGRGASRPAPRPGSSRT